MIGAIAGDIIGSRFEFGYGTNKSKEFELFPETVPTLWTDDTVMTLATAEAILEMSKCKGEFSYRKAEDIFIKNYQKWGRKYPEAGYGGSFHGWIFDDDPQPYGSFGNGSAMRVSPCGLATKNIEAAVKLAEVSARVTHNHPEGIKGAKCVSGAVFLAKQGASKSTIKDFVEEYYQMDFTLEEIRPSYHFEVSCQKSVPQALQCFLESESYEDCIRNVVSLGGDTDTQGAIAGAVAGRFYGVPKEIKEQALAKLDDYQLDVYNRFNTRFKLDNN